MIDVVAAVIRRDGRLLLGRRPASGSAPGQWEFPGGKVQAGETPEAALGRELREELGVSARATHFLGESILEASAIRLLFYATEITGEPVPHHHQALRWVRPAELATLDLLPGDRAFARELAAAAEPPEGAR